MSTVVSPWSAAALHGLLDAPGPPPADGDPLPPLWHWLALAAAPATAELGPDGHPAAEVASRPAGLPRRMFAGGAVTISDPPVVGSDLPRTTTTTATRETTGSSGRLVFSTVEHRLPGVVEEQHVVYREPAGQPAPQPGDPTPPSPALGWPWRIDLPVDPVVLFRFSALTYNAHRIHYDLEWTTRVEGYPGLVVHGPLQAIGLAELCRRFAPARSVRRFSFRALRPAFAATGATLACCGREAEGGEAELVAVDATGAETMRATATLAEAE